MDELVIEKTLFLVKPEGVERGLIGECLKRLENKRLRVIHLRMLYPSEGMVEEHYRQHSGREFFPELVKQLANNPVVAVAVEGPNAIAWVRRLVGSYKLQEHQPGTIRGDFANHIRINVAHSSDSPEAAQREIDLWFPGEF